ncbi:DNA-directed RNA polymerase subunit beta' [bacterium]|nr:DNA-directed RNA polymerase subunit beta' [bacterium]
MRVADIKSIIIKLASPEEILSWSHGEVTKPETINYRTQRAEKDGLFCERIFGPEKDYECYCGKYKGIRYKGIVCDRCGVEVTRSSVRRERMGHIKLACPVSHIWFLRGTPSRMGMLLDIPMPQLERVIYFGSHIVTKVSEEMRKKVLEEIEREYQAKLKTAKKKQEKEELREVRDKAKEELLSIQPLKILSEIQYRTLSLKYGQVFEAGTGAEVLRKIFEKIDLKELAQKLEREAKEATPANQRKILRRLKMVKRMLAAGVRPEWMFLTVLPVLPPDLRPMVQLDGGRYASSDLNDLYRRVINRNNRLKRLLETGAPEVIIRSEKRMLQEAVDALIDNGMRRTQTTTTATTGGRRSLKSLADMLKGKQGRFRGNLLGKRVDYSGRSVIVVGPELKLYQCGIPKKMALELFKPFVVAKLLQKELSYNVKKAIKLIEEEKEEVWAALEEVVKDKLVLLNREPTLHRLGIQAFEPLLIEEQVIRLHPLVCKAFNADFDGDQMAVYVPLSEQAQKEAKERILSSRNLLKPATGTPIVSPTKDMVLGCYWITKIKEKALGEGKIFSSKNEAILAYQTGVIDLRAKIKVRIEGKLIETSVGRILFNNTLPDGHPFVNENMDSKKLDRLTGEIIENYDNEKVVTSLDKIKELGFEAATLSGITWGMDDLVVPSQKKKLIKEAEKEVEKINKYFEKGLLSREERRTQIIEIWQKTKEKIEELVPKTLPSLGPVFTIVDSGARGSWSQPVQMAGMKGLVINPAGQIIEMPVKHSYKEGLDVLEYFISTHGARKGTADTALRTSSAGYLTRRLIDVAHEVVITEEDCGDQKGITIFKKDADEIGQNFLFKIVGRVSLDDIKGIIKKGEIINWKKGQAIVKAGIDKVRVRSPLSCKSLNGICQKCYGWDLGNNQLIKIGEAVGIVAAQAIGEPGTQLTLRTFHTGGVAGASDITQGLPRVEEVFESRVPKGRAVISQVKGKVIEITRDRVIKIGVHQDKEKKGRKGEIIEYKIPPKRAIWVKVGEEVEKGQQLCEGHLDLKELFNIVGKEDTQRYIIKEIQNIYVSQGALIHDKHIEVIVRQMFSRVRVKDPGDSSFVPGEVIEKRKAIEENLNLKKQNKKLATFQPILLGISKVALTTDSFLSAASFQETSRVLIKAAIEGSVDKLRGLKENVIIGKLIPVGTGFKRNSNSEKDN